MLYWRLLFPNGTGAEVADEPDEECSIGLVGRPNAGIIVVTRPGPDGERVPVVGEPLSLLGATMLGKDPDQYLRERGATPWAPVFYRKKSMTIEMNGQMPTTDLVVFGRARITGEGRLDGHLFAVYRDGTVGPCPAWALDAAATENLVRDIPPS